MFKKLRDRLAEEANRLPVSHIAFGNNASKLSDDANKIMATEDLITLSDSSAVIIPHPSAHQFSIAEDDDSCLSEQSSPLKKGDNSSSNLDLTLNSSSKYQELVSDEQRSPDLHHTVHHTDNESEVENPPTLNLDEISKEQLLSSIQTQKARVYKYKNKYFELVKSFNVVSEDKRKIERALIESQDKNLRRIGELREQYQLEQKAKADLEENLRVNLEEKDSIISVLKTKIDLLKECQYNDNSNASEAKHSEKELLSNEDIISGNEDEKKTISEYEETFKNLNGQLLELKQQQEDSVMAMAETKKNMHQELELKELQLTEAKEESRKLQNALDHEKMCIRKVKKEHEQKVLELQGQLEKLEQSLEDEKQNLMNEFARGKAEAITLIQAEHGKKLSSLEEEWKIKLEALTVENNQKLILSEEEVSTLKQKINHLENNLKILEDEKSNVVQQLLLIQNQEIEQTQSELVNSMTLLKEHNAQLTEENNSLKNKFQEKDNHIKEMVKEMSETKNQMQHKIEKNSAELKNSKKQHSELEMKLADQIALQSNSEQELKTTISMLEREKEDSIRKVKMLETEREQLMLQAQERISSAEAKHREDISQLETKLQEFNVQNLQIERLRKENTSLITQMDSLNLEASSEKERLSSELENLNIQFSKLEAELHAERQVHSDQQKETHILQRQCEESADRNKNLQQMIDELQSEVTRMKLLKKESEELKEKFTLMEASHNEIIEDNNKKLLNSEILSEENKQLNTKIGCLEYSITELHESMQLLKKENEELRTSVKENSCSVNDAAEHQTSGKNLVQSEISLDESLKHLQNSEYEYIVMKLQSVIKKLPYQIKNSDLDWDQIFTELIELIHDQENDLRRTYQVEIAALRQDIFEKDSALEEMHEHYEEILKEKSTKIAKYETELKSVQELTNRMPNSNLGAGEGVEISDWDDAWYLPEESCCSASPTHSSKPNCDDHTLQIESLEKELAKCNSELKDLRILLRLTPPHSLQSSLTKPIHVLEATEFEYLRNILFQYMLGKETVTLIKVIAAVLKFDEQQTQLIMERESLKQSKAI